MNASPRCTLFVEPAYAVDISAALDTAGLRHLFRLVPRSLGVRPADWAMGGHLQLYHIGSTNGALTCGALDRAFAAIRARIGDPMPGIEAPAQARRRQQE
jgi:hypothetical protein